VSAGGGLDAAALARLCAERPLVRAAIWLPEAESTQDEARRRALRCGPGVLVVAGSQTRGRGRLGRSWWSPPAGGLYLSLAVAPSRPREEWAFLSALAGLALREAIRDASGVDCGIKWPNDLLARGRKLAGILAEAGGEPWAVLGVGVNVGQAEADFPPELRGAATSIAIERAWAGGGAVEAAAVLEALLEALLGSLERWLGRFAADGPAAGRDALRRASILIGRAVALATTEGTAPLRGRVIDVGPGGELVLETRAGGAPVSVSGGEILEIVPPLRDPADEG
jgi:BirA family biotin operon repressor/biotin-[acetyl-CoA-carboxylase] ligase